MPSATYDEALDRAAETWGIQPDYWDIWGQHHVTPPETKRAILASLGIRADTKEELDRAIEQQFRDAWSRVLPPCLVISENQRPREFAVHLPAELGERQARIVLKIESGDTEALHTALGELPVAEEAEFDGRRYVRKLVALPERLPLGYHDVEILVGGVCASMRLIVAPDRAYLPPSLRAAGIAIALYGVRSASNWGCGDFRDLHGIIDWVADEVRASFVALNPLHAIHNRGPYNTSPYLPNSVYYRNFLYLDVEGIADLTRCPRAQRLLTDAATQREIEALRASEFVEYERVSALKLKFLKRIFAAFLRGDYRCGTTRALQFQEYFEREGEPLRP